MKISSTHILKLKPILLIAFFTLSPLAGYSETLIDPGSQMTMDKSCIDNGRDSLKTRYPNINNEDINSISLYGCFCAYKEAQKSSLSVEATNYRNVSNCIYYAVLRTSMSPKNDTTSGEQSASEGIKSPTSGEIKNRCISIYPRDLKDDSINEDIANFCNCASVPVEQIDNQIKPLKLNEDQIYDKLITLIKSCR